MKKIIDFIRGLIKKMRKLLGKYLVLGCVCLILLSVGSYCMSTYVTKALSGATTDTTVVVNTKGISNLSAVVKYTQTFTATSTQAAVVTFYGTFDDGTTYYKLGVNPLLTGTRDGDGAISFTTVEASSTVLYGYELVGNPQYVYIDWNDTKVGTGDATGTIWIIGKEW